MPAPDPLPLQHSLLRPVRAGHAFEACVEQLATTIRLGVYPRGATLPPERELARMMHVSRATLREAIAALREAGLVETVRGRGGGTVVTLRPRTPGARAASRTTDEQRRAWRDTLEFRRVVEPGAVHLAARRSAERQLAADELDELRSLHEAVTAARRPAEHRQADARLHLCLASLSGSPRLVEGVTSAQATLHEMLVAIPVLETNIHHSDRQHAAITRAVLDGRPEPARRAMLEHCDDTAALLRGFVG